jgi:DNA (cytosine-5)-methyltransferase 1
MEQNTVRELIQLCKARGVKGYSGKNKAQILALLQKPKYRVLSLFSGMGGMDIGFAEQVVVARDSVDEAYVSSPHDLQGFVNLARLPFEIVFQNDILPEAQAIATLNGWAHNYHLKDLRELLAEHFAFPSADVVIGGFPCQDFSHAGLRQGFASDRGTLYQSFVEVVRRVQPIVFVAENVQGLLTMPGAPLERIVADFSAVGYEVQYQLLRCEEHGIPQTRWRVILMGIRLDKRRLVGTGWNLVTENRRTCHVRPYLRHLAEPAVSTDIAQQVYSKAARLAKGQGQKEIGLDEFAPTMRAEHHGNIEFRRVAGGKHAVEESGLGQRRLTVREVALLQTFPPDCKLAGAVKQVGKAYKPLGNAVPPLLGYLVARKVWGILDTLGKN